MQTYPSNIHNITCKVDLRVKIFKYNQSHLVSLKIEMYKFITYLKISKFGTRACASQMRV